MPSPLAHVGLALSVHVAARPRGVALVDRTALAAAFASIAPDLDIVAAALLPGGIAWHRGPSHSLVGALLIGALVAFAARLPSWRDRAVVAVAALLHVPLDYTTGQPGTPSSYGVPWLWPVDPRKAIDASPWFGAYHIDRPGFLANMLAPEALPVYGKEAFTVAIAGLAALALRRVRRWRASSRMEPAER